VYPEKANKAYKGVPGLLKGHSGAALGPVRLTARLAWDSRHKYVYIRQLERMGQ
jgi:hypothetical protein